MAANPKAQIQLLKELAKSQSDKPTIDALNFAIAWLETAMPWTVDKMEYALCDRNKIIALRDKLVELGYDKTANPDPDNNPNGFTYCDFNDIDDFYAMITDWDSIWAPEDNRYGDSRYDYAPINDQLEMRLFRGPQFNWVSIMPKDEE